jgi:hypothetical protein
VLRLWPLHCSAARPQLVTEFYKVSQDRVVAGFGFGTHQAPEDRSLQHSVRNLAHRSQASVCPKGGEMVPLLLETMKFTLVSDYDTIFWFVVSTAYAMYSIPLFQVK